MTTTQVRLQEIWRDRREELSVGLGRVEQVGRGEDEEEQHVAGDSDINNQLESKNERIAELEAQLSDQNLLKQKLTETKAKLEYLSRESRSKTCDLPQYIFEYNPDNDEVIAAGETALDKFVDDKYNAKQDREARK